MIDKDSQVIGKDGEITPSSFVDVLKEFSTLAIERRDWIRRYYNCHIENEKNKSTISDFREEVSRLQGLLRKNGIDFTEE